MVYKCPISPQSKTLATYSQRGGFKSPIAEANTLHVNNPFITLLHITGNQPSEGWQSNS